ncbi:MAG: hypothetical protein ABWY13_11155 [Mesorhizobium sp.]|jgi:hypothetical protein
MKFNHTTCGWLFSLLLVWPTAAWAADPVIRAQILTPPPIVAGQQVQVQVDVLVPNFFMSAPQFPLFNLPNAIVTLPDTGALNLTENIDGEAYAGIRRVYVITPQIGGDFTLPPATIPFTYAAVPGQPTNGVVTLPQEKFTVGGAAGAADSMAATAAKLTVTQSLDREPTGLKAGDALVRTVTVTAEGMQAMMIPTPQFDAPEGTRIYKQDPMLSDHAGNQGSIGGKRIDRVTYQFEKPGSYTLPAAQISWYDPSERRNEIAEAPGIAVTVLEEAAFKPALAPPPSLTEAPSTLPFEWRRYLPWTVGAFALFLLGWITVRLLPQFQQWRERRRLQRGNSEPAFFRRFEEACRNGDQLAAYAALDAWSRRVHIGPVDAWLAVAADVPTQQEFAAYERMVFGNAQRTEAWDPAKLLAGIGRSRTALLARKHAQGDVAGALPPLNP